MINRRGFIRAAAAVPLAGCAKLLPYVQFAGDLADYVTTVLDNIEATYDLASDETIAEAFAATRYSVEMLREVAHAVELGQNADVAGSKAAVLAAYDHLYKLLEHSGLMMLAATRGIQPPPTPADLRARAGL